jgi:hypothetical protein
MKILLSVLISVGFLTQLFAQSETFQPLELSGVWMFTAGKEPAERNPKEGWEKETIPKQIGNRYEFWPKYKINEQEKQCEKDYKTEVLLEHGMTKEENFERSTKIVTNVCKDMFGDRLLIEKFDNKEIYTYCSEDKSANIHGVFKYDEETMTGTVGGDYQVCLKRIDVQELKISAEKKYTGEVLKGKHLFAFDFPFQIPQKLEVSEESAGRSTVNLMFKKLKTKTWDKCIYKGNAPKVKKGSPPTVSKEFIFQGCSSGLKGGETASGAQFSLTVLGGLMIEGANKTAVNLVLNRHKP